MTVVVFGIFLLVVAAVAYVALRNARDFSDANEVIPGIPTSAPKAWAGAHSPEARLHRRLRDAMTALRANASLDDPALRSVRDLLQQEALAVDERLVAAAALPARVRTEPMLRVSAAVEAIEETVADVVAMRGPAGTELTAGLEAVQERLGFVAEARRELEAIDPLSGSFPPLASPPESVPELRHPPEAAPGVTDLPPPPPPPAPGPEDDRPGDGQQSTGGG